MNEKIVEKFLTVIEVFTKSIDEHSRLIREQREILGEMYTQVLKVKNPKLYEEIKKDSKEPL